VRPYSKGFSVTPKGNAASTDIGVSLFRQTLLPSSVLLVMNVVVLLRIILDLSEASTSVGTELALYGTIWCAINIALLVMCILMSLERPQPRQEHRIHVHRPARLITATDQSIEGVLEDLSMSGARFKAEPSRNGNGNQPQAVALELADGVRLPVERAWPNYAGDLVMHFASLDLNRQKQLIGYAFSGEFHSAEQPQRVRLGRTFKQLLQTVLG
jgi:hypothetical protein